MVGLRVGGMRGAKVKRAALYARALWQRWREKRAARKRRDLKRRVLIYDMHRFYAGEVSAFESRQFRDHAYAVLDAMSTEEILDL